MTAALDYEPNSALWLADRVFAELSRRGYPASQVGWVTARIDPLVVKRAAPPTKRERKRTRFPEEGILFTVGKRKVHVRFWSPFIRVSTGEAMAYGWSVYIEPVREPGSRRILRGKQIDWVGTHRRPMTREDENAIVTAAVDAIEKALRLP